MVLSESVSAAVRRNVVRAGIRRANFLPLRVQVDWLNDRRYDVVLAVSNECEAVHAVNDRDDMYAGARDVAACAVARAGLRIERFRNVLRTVRRFFFDSVPDS